MASPSSGPSKNRMSTGNYQNYREKFDNCFSKYMCAQSNEYAMQRWQSIRCDLAIAVLIGSVTFFGTK